MAEVYQIHIKRHSDQIDEHEIWKKAEECFTDTGYVYLVLDYAVAIGKFEGNEYSLCLDGLNIIHRVSETYIKELIIFNQNQEFRAMRSGSKFLCRRCCDLQNEGEAPDHCIDQIYKVWGKAERIKGLEGWSALQSKRGSRIYYPEELEKDAELGLLVRRYLRFPKASEKRGLIEYFDERLCGFGRWQPDQRPEHGGRASDGNGD